MRSWTEIQAGGFGKRDDLSPVQLQVKVVREAQPPPLQRLASSLHILQHVLAHHPDV